MDAHSSAREIQDWRREERRRLVEMRRSISAAERRLAAMKMSATLDQLLVLDSDSVVSLYWPFRGEPDLRHWMQELIKRNIRVALPVVAVRAQPMEFREWTPEAVLQPGIWNIPVPRDGELLQPTHVIAPVVGYDDAAYRLGNGGGYFDRTLAQMASLGQTPLVIGVGPAHLHIPTIYPQAHDVPMDLVVTDTLVLRRPAIQTDTAVQAGPEEPADGPVVS